jgi:hypothetical protein
MRLAVSERPLSLEDAAKLCAADGAGLFFPENADDTFFAASLVSDAFEEAWTGAWHDDIGISIHPGSTTASVDASLATTFMELSGSAMMHPRSEPLQAQQCAQLHYEGFVWGECSRHAHAAICAAVSPDAEVAAVPAVIPCPLAGAEQDWVTVPGLTHCIRVVSLSNDSDVAATCASAAPLEANTTAYASVSDSRATWLWTALTAAAAYDVDQDTHAFMVGGSDLRSTRLGQPAMPGAGATAALLPFGLRTARTATLGVCRMDLPACPIGAFNDATLGCAPCPIGYTTASAAANALSLCEVDPSRPLRYDGLATGVQYRWAESFAEVGCFSDEDGSLALASTACFEGSSWKAGDVSAVELEDGRRFLLVVGLGHADGQGFVRLGVERILEARLDETVMGLCAFDATTGEALWMHAEVVEDMDMSTSLLALTSTVVQQGSRTIPASVAVEVTASSPGEAIVVSATEVELSSGEH